MRPPEQPFELYVRRDSRPSESIDIERLLSSTIYPGANPNYIHNDTVPAEAPSLQFAAKKPAQSAPNSAGTVLIEEGDTDAPEPPGVDAGSPNNDKAAKHEKKTPAQGKAAGSKRKPDDGGNKGPGRRRRKQIREAQRAYRQRKVSQTACLEERVTQLGSAIENMSTVVLSFSEELVGSNILSCQSDLTNRLRDALATCLSLVREIRNDSLEQEPVGSAGPVASSIALVPSIPPSVPNKPTSIKNMFGNKLYPDMNTDMTVAAFMNMLATSAVYYGYLALADPTLSATRLHRRFGLPLQFVNRDKLLSYFSSLFQARLYRVRGIECPPKSGMPFFSIGGAGTHYSAALASTPSASAPDSLPWANTADQYETWTERNNAWTVLMDTSNVPANIQERFEGDWFDMQDLELFLLEKGVRLRMKPNRESHGDINVSMFLQGLMLNTTCLGQCPGFRRRDVEVALKAAQCGPQAYPDIAPREQS